MSVTLPANDALVIEGLRKRYGTTDVLRGVDMRVRPGTVHALLGPNGAGKSTLIKCLCGSVGWDAGAVLLGGEVVKDLTPASAREAGIATIHQHFSLVGTLSITDNLFLGRELRKGLWTRKRAQRTAAASLISRFGLTTSPDALVGRLGAGRKQLVEIAKAWVDGDVRILILDEPTASLSSEESETLFAELARLKSEGVCIIYVTHRLSEVFRIADDVTVLRNGAVELTGTTTSLRPEQIMTALSGTHTGSRPQRTIEPNERAGGLSVKDLHGARFGPVSLDLAPGEVVGLFGPLGAGRTSFLESLVGRHSPFGGSMSVDGRKVTPSHPRAARRNGVVLVPADRGAEGIWPTQSTSFNALLPRYDMHAARWFRSPAAERGAYADVVRRLEITPPGPDVPMAHLSGGNAQKVMIGRWLTANDELRVLLVDEPTNGVDVRARGHIHAALRSAANDGVAVLMSSSDADELALYADRVLVFADGLVVAELVGDDITPERLLGAAHQLADVLPTPERTTRNFT